MVLFSILFVRLRFKVSIQRKESLWSLVVCGAVVPQRLVSFRVHPFQQHSGGLRENQQVRAFP